MRYRVYQQFVITTLDGNPYLLVEDDIIKVILIDMDVVSTTYQHLPVKFGKKELVNISKVPERIKLEKRNDDEG